MKPTDRCGCALVVAVAGCAAWTAQHQIVRTNEALFHAIAARDVATLERLLAPEFRFAQQGLEGDRRAFLDGVARRAETVEWITNDELRLHVDGRRAVLCGVQRARVLVAGKPVADEGKFCDRWEERDGRWQVTFAGDAVEPQ